MVDVDSRAESMERLEEMLEPLLPSVACRPREEVRVVSNAIDIVAARASRECVVRLCLSRSLDGREGRGQLAYKEEGERGRTQRGGGREYKRGAYVEPASGSSSLSAACARRYGPRSMCAIFLP